MSDIRMQKPDDVRRMLVQVANEVRSAENVDVIQKARTLTYIAATLLTSMEKGIMEQRLTAIEKQLSIEHE